MVRFIVSDTGISWSNKSILTYVMNKYHRSRHYDKLFFINELFRQTKSAFENGDISETTQLLDLPYKKDLYTLYLSLGDTQTGTCPSLYFVVYHNHNDLTHFVISTLEPHELTYQAFRLACYNQNNTIINMFCEKDPTRFYIITYPNGNIQGKMRTLAEQRDYIAQQRKQRLDRLYTTLTIHRFAKPTKQNIVLTGIPSDVTRYILQMI